MFGPTLGLAHLKVRDRLRTYDNLTFFATPYDSFFMHALREKNVEVGDYKETGPLWPKL